MWGSPTIGVTAEYPLNLQGASSPTLVKMAPACGWQGALYRTAQKLLNVPPCVFPVCPKRAQEKDHYPPPYDRSGTYPQRAEEG